MALEIAPEARTLTGKASKRLRRDGLVPGVVFGKGRESMPVQIEARSFEALYREAGRTSIIRLTAPGASRATSVIMKSVQRQPITGQALHVDFFVVDLKHEMQADVPLVFTGEPPAVEQFGGVLFTQLDHLRVRALPADIPHEVSVDLSPLVDLETAIHVRDLVVDDSKVHLLNDPDELVARVSPPRVEEEPEVPEAEAAGEGEEPADEDAETAEGEGASGRDQAGA